MAKKKKHPRDWDDEDRRSFGFMTVDEFVEKFSFGLRMYLHNNWKSNEPNELHHPEDLTSSMLCYAESVFETVQVFGVGNTNER